jgi:hypothetical protein
MTTGRPRGGVNTDWERENTVEGTNENEVVTEFDQTNGQAPGIDGEDGGAIADNDTTKHGVLADLVEDVETGFQDRDDDASDTDAETAYSEEGKP